MEENKYVFNMKLNILDGYLKKQLDLINDDKSDIESLEYEFLQNIWVPILFGNNINDTFEKNNDFPFAFCNTNQKISNFNLNSLKKDGFDIECFIPIPEEQSMTGIIKIKPFYDQIYMKINNETSNDNKVIFVNIYYNINRTIEQINNINTKIDEKNNLRRNEEITDNITNDINNEEIGNNTETDEHNFENKTQIITERDKYLSSLLIDYNETKNNNEDNNNAVNQTKIFTTIDYYLINDNLNKLYCPDKPMFIINNIKDIQLYSSQKKTYAFFLKGQLSFKYHHDNNNINYDELDKTKEEITFNLQVTDNLAENEDNQKSIVNCTIPNDTYFINKSIIIYCYGNKITEESMKKNDTDITLNWGIDINRIHEKIIIKWPFSKKRKKHMYSYTIKAYSLSQTNYGCFNNDFYFYMHIYDLGYEPDILFEVKMENPKQPKAVCKIYESSVLKCYFPLYKERLVKNTKISLPTNITYEINDSRGNKIIFIVDDYYYDYEDFHIIVKETCGDFVFIGVLKKAGFSYFIIIIGYICIGSFILVIFLCFISYIKYKIKHRNRKGGYFAHIEEGENSNIKSKKMDITSSLRK